MSPKNPVPRLAPRRNAPALVMFTTALAVGTPSAARAACTINLTQPAANSTQTQSPLFKWAGDCSSWRVNFSPSGTFGADKVVTNYGTRKTYQMAEDTWDAYQAGTWASGVWWRVQGRAADGTTTTSVKRKVFMDPDLDDDGASVGAGGDCDDDNPAVHPGAAETCNGSDDDCSGDVDPGCPVRGDLVISEVMPNPALSADADGAWFELFNTGVSPLDLAGVTFECDGQRSTLVSPLPLDPGEWHAFLANADVARNGYIIDGTALAGFEWWTPFVAGYPLRVFNSLSELLDEVWYADALGDDFADPPNGGSMAVEPLSLDPDQNDDPTAWCRSPAPYGAGDLGTPGYENTPCPGPGNQVDWMNLQWPPTLTASASATDVGLIFGEVYEPYVTDFVGPGQGILGEVGYGPSGTFADDPSWLWFLAEYNVDADGLYYGDHANDEHMGTFPPPAPGTWAYAFRYTADGGLTWVYGDLDGSSNGYDPAQAGVLVVE